MQHKKEARPALESRRASAKKCDPIITQAMNPKAVTASAVAVLFLLVVLPRIIYAVLAPIKGWM